LNDESTALEGTPRSRRVEGEKIYFKKIKMSEEDEEENKKEEEK
jgi:hypothetical protein